jgi:hypothetical protein
LGGFVISTMDKFIGQTGEFFDRSVKLAIAADSVEH